MEYTSVVGVMNDKSALLEVVIEPWAYSIFLRPGSRLSVELTGSQRTEPLLGVRDDLVAVYASSGCSCVVTVDGVKQDFPWLLMRSP